MKAGSRIRSIKPEWLDDEKLAACSDGARVLSVAVILVADDHGCGRANPTWLAGIAWTYHEDPDRPRRVAEFLRELDECGFIHTYTVRGQRYYEIVNWRKHQRCDNAGKRRVPGPDEADGGVAPAAAPVSGAPSETVAAVRGDFPQSAARARTLSVSRSDSDSDSESPPRERPPGTYRAVELGLRNELRSEGIIPTDLTSGRWNKITNWILDYVDDHREWTAETLTRSLVRGFKDDPKAAGKGWPFPWLVQNPLEYIGKRAGPVTREEVEASGTGFLSDDEVIP